MTRHLVGDRALPGAVRTWVPLEALLTTLEDLLAAAVPVTFGFVTSPRLSDVLATLKQSEGQKAFLAAARVLESILRTLQIRSGPSSQHLPYPLLPSSVFGCYAGQPLNPLIDASDNGLDAQETLLHKSDCRLVNTIKPEVNPGNLLYLLRRVRSWHLRSCVNRQPPM